MPAPKKFLTMAALLDEVRAHSVLWNTGNKMHFNTLAKNSAWENVADKFQDATPQKCESMWAAAQQAKKAYNAKIGRYSSRS
ncbi:hypothetical protein FOCC_FOCC006646 [Frankliniella occidentalis]|nr:hypothetical protein FOCC_FOCC006646 [Frankliniella occidentalis]